MNRRSTFKLLGAGGLATLGAGFVYLRHDHAHAHLTMDRVMERLEGLDVSTLSATGSWESARIFDHLAQGVEFSLTGYPELKPALFRSTVGPLAFSVFAAKGSMSHGLDEEIPGEVLRNVDAQIALDRLKSALRSFDEHQGTLAPHFAYGALSKTDYAAAHAMHVNNHFEELPGA